MPETTQTQKHALSDHTEAAMGSCAQIALELSVFCSVWVFVYERKFVTVQKPWKKNSMITELLVILYIVKYLCYSEQKRAHSVSAGWVDLFVHV